MKKMLLLSVLLLGGCANTFSDVKYLYDGSNGPVYEASCHGSYKTLGDCYKEAGQTCSGDFKVINRSEKYDKNYTNPFAQGGDPSGVNWDQFAKMRRTVIFYCLR